jgi:hypothetical protein
MNIKNITAAREQLDKTQKMQRMLMRMAETAASMKHSADEEKLFATRDNMARVLSIIRREHERMVSLERTAETYLRLEETRGPVEHRLAE